MTVGGPSRRAVIGVVAKKRGVSSWAWKKERPEKTEQRTRKNSVKARKIVPTPTRTEVKIVTWRTGLKFRPLRGLGVGNIIYTIRLIQKYMVIEVLLCGLGSLVSE